MELVLTKKQKTIASTIIGSFLEEMEKTDLNNMTEFKTSSNIAAYLECAGFSGFNFQNLLKELKEVSTLSNDNNVIGDNFKYALLCSLNDKSLINLTNKLVFEAGIISKNKEYVDNFTKTWILELKSLISIIEGYCSAIIEKNHHN